MSVILGIDPDKGLAISDNGKIVKCITVSGMEEMLNIIPKLIDQYKITEAFIELPRTLKVYHRPGQSVFAMQKIALNVGMNRQKAEEIIRYCKRLCNVTETRIPKGYSKLSAEQFKKYTGYMERTSSHARDAGVLLLGRR